MSPEKQDTETRDTEIPEKIRQKDRRRPAEILIRCPLSALTENPTISLVGGILAGIFFSSALWLAGGGRLFIPDPATAAVPALMICLLPFVFFERRKRRIIEKAEDCLPLFLKDISEGVKCGRPFSDAVGAQRHIGKSPDEIRLMRAKLAAGFSLEDVLKEKDEAGGSPVIRKALFIVVTAEKAGGRVSDALAMAAADVRRAVDERRERKTHMMPYAVSMALSYLIFAGIAVFLTAFFFGGGLTEAPDPSNTVNGVFSMPGFSAAGGSASPSGHVPPAAVMIFHALLIQGVFCGLICGRMIHGKALSGIGYSIFLVWPPWLIFTFLI